MKAPRVHTRSRTLPRQVPKTNVQLTTASWRDTPEGLTVPAGYAGITQGSGQTNIVPALRTWEGFRMQTDRDRLGRQVLVTAGTMPQPTLDISWLKAAAEVYDLSSDPKDYVFTEVPANNADLPNRNMDAFPYEELVKYRPILGMMAYQSYRGKLCSANHDNKEPKKAKGLNFDASMVQIKGHWHTKVISGWCRQKDARLATRILGNKDAGYSMACLIGGASCSVCGYFSQGTVTCRHINGGVGKGLVTPTGELIYDLCRDLNFWELAHVEDRADIDAIKDWAQ